MSEPPWLARARALVGISEIAGSRHEPEVVAFFAEAGVPEIRDDETAWCGAFVAAMFVAAGRAEVRPPGDRYNALRAREWLNVGVPVASPRPGDIAVFSRGGKNATTGHVAFFLSEDGDSIEVLGGNQSNRVSIARYARDRLLGYRRVPAAPVARSERSAAAPAPPTRQPDDPGVDPSEATAPRRDIGTGAAAAGAAGAAVIGAAGGAGLWWLAAAFAVATLLILTRRLWWPRIFGERQ